MVLDYASADSFEINLCFNLFMNISENIFIQWECTGMSSRCSSEKSISKRNEFSKGSTSEYSPAKLLLNGVGWSIPQSQRAQGAKNLMPLRHDVHRGSMQMHASTSCSIKAEPWFWFPSIASSWDGPDFLGRAVGLKEEHPWKIKASVIYSVRAHQGAVRSLAICPDEFNVFTAGIGSGFKGMVQRWELSTVNCVSGYYGHEEVFFFFFLSFLFDHNGTLLFLIHS